MLFNRLPATPLFLPLAFLLACGSAQCPGTPAGEGGAGGGLQPASEAPRKKPAFQVAQPSPIAPPPPLVTGPATSGTGMPEESRLELLHRALRSGDHAAARAHFEAVLRSPPASPDVRHLLASLAAEEGFHAEAMALLKSLEPDPTEEGQLDLAQRALLSRDFEAAHGHLGPVLRQSLDSARARFLLACLALEEGRLAEALTIATGLKVDLPYGEAAILATLIESRHAERPWREALIAGWQASGSPDLTRSTLLDDPPRPADLAERLEKAVREATDPHEQALLELIRTDASSAERLVTLLPRIHDPRIAAAVMTRLRRPQTGAPPAAHLEAVRRRARELSALHPATSQFSLIALLAGSRTDAPFTLEELAEIERLAALKVVEPDHIRTLFEDARRRYRKHQLPFASGEVLHMVTRTFFLGDDARLLQHRTTASWPLLAGAEQERLAETMWALGSSIQATKELGPSIAGAELMFQVARLQKDGDRERKASHMLGQSRNAKDTSERLAWEGWPLPSIQDAFAEAVAEDGFRTANEVTSIATRMGGLP